MSIQIERQQLNGGLVRRLLCQFGFCLLFVSMQVPAQTVVNVTTTEGNFSIELFDSSAPGTVQNFLNYVNSQRFNDSVVHRMVPNFVIQGGWLNIAEGTTAFTFVDTDGTITNEPGLSNLRGTVAMAKVPGNPDSATSQWFINLADNTALDTDNGGFTVFGRVIDNGMAVVDSIGALQRVSGTFAVEGQSVALTELPVRNFNGASITRDNLILVDMAVAAQTVAPNRFDNSTGQLLLRVDAGSAGIVELAFTIESQEPSVVIRALAETVVNLPAVSAGFSTFDPASGQLVIPELEVDGSVAFRNLVLTLTDAQQLLFTLQSFE